MSVIGKRTCMADTHTQKVQAECNALPPHFVSRGGSRSLVIRPRARCCCVWKPSKTSPTCDLPVPVRNESTLGKVTMPVIDTGVAAWNCFCMDSNLASFCWQKLGAGVGKPTLLKAQEEKVDNIPGGGHRGGSLLSRPPSKSTRSALIFHLSESQWRGGAGIRMQGALGPLLAWGWRGP